MVGLRRNLADRLEKESKWDGKVIEQYSVIGR